MFNPGGGASDGWEVKDQCDLFWTVSRQSMTHAAGDAVWARGKGLPVGGNGNPVSVAARWGCAFDVFVTIA